MRVEQSISFIIGKGDRGTILTADLDDVLLHVYVFSASELPNLTDKTSPATGGVTSSSLTKDGADNVLLPRIIWFAWSQVGVRGRRCPIVAPLV